MNKIDHSRITTRQLFFSVTCFILSSALLTTFFSAVTYQDSWISVIIGALITIPVMILMAQLMKMYPDKSLLCVCCEVFGKTVGKILSVIYLIFFLILASLNLGDLGYFIQSTIMNNTPTLLVVVLFMFVCAQAVKGGAQIVCRYSMLFTFVFLSILVVGTTLSLPLFHLENFLPVFHLPFVKYVQGAHIMSMIPLAETTVFLMFMPAVSGDKSKLNRYLILALIFGTISILIIVIRNTAVLNDTIHLLSLPPFEVFRLINVSSAMSHMEILFAVSFIMLFFFKVSVVFYAAVIAFSETFGLKSYKSIVYLVGALIVAMSFNLYYSNIEHIYSAMRFTAFQWMLPEIIIPLALLIGGKIKNKKKQNQPQQSMTQTLEPASPDGAKTEAAQQ